MRSGKGHPIKEAVAELDLRDGVILAVALFLLALKAMKFCLLRRHGPTAVKSLDVTKGLRTSFFRSIAAEATKFTDVSRSNLAGNSGLLTYVLVVVKNSPTKATNNVGAAAITILLLATVSILEKGGSARYCKEGVAFRVVEMKVAVALIAFIF